MSGEREVIVRLIREARESVRRAFELADIPALRKALQDADVMLHWSLWHLGAEDGLSPEEKRESTRKGNLSG